MDFLVLPICAASGFNGDIYHELVTFCPSFSFVAIQAFSEHLLKWEIQAISMPCIASVNINCVS